MTNLWSANTPASFWQCEQVISDEDWEQAIQQAMPELRLPTPPGDLESLLFQTLGEGQFGNKRWRLSPAKQVYYSLKPLLPRAFTRLLRQVHSRPAQAGSGLGWPAEERYARFLWAVMEHLLTVIGVPSLTIRYFWPAGADLALVLTHDVETAEGQAYVRTVADLDESLGFRSSFNFVPERYQVDRRLLGELRERGFEVGVHGLKHDGKLFRSAATFARRARRINDYLEEWDAVGFRTPLTHRHAEWMQGLNIAYDLSFFDTDPYEPMPGGTMSIWPFEVGRFLELPYTLVQDYTLTAVLGETTPRLWLEKMDVIQTYHGMALLNSHPDYLRADATRAVYVAFLEDMKARGGFWNALPREVASWWKARSMPHARLAGLVRGKVELQAGGLVLSRETPEPARLEAQGAVAGMAVTLR